MSFVVGLLIGGVIGYYAGAKIVETVKGWLAKKE